MTQHGLSMQIHITVSFCLFPAPSPLCYQGIIQDVKLIFAPNGYITQCPNLNRSKYHDDTVPHSVPQTYSEQWSREKRTLSITVYHYKIGL